MADDKVSVDFTEDELLDLLDLFWSVGLHFNMSGEFDGLFVKYADRFYSALLGKIEGGLIIL